MQTIKAIRNGQEITMHRCELCWTLTEHCAMDNGFIPATEPYRHFVHCKNSPRPLFPLGQVVTTPGAFDAMADMDVAAIAFFSKGWEFMTTAQRLLQRHASGDWGDMDAEDKATNDASVGNGEGTIGWGNRLLSVYKLSDTLTIWIMTEADRSVTTFLLPSEY